jgi:hypothetical protein
LAGASDTTSSSLGLAGVAKGLIGATKPPSNLGIVGSATSVAVVDYYYYYYYYYYY